MGRFGNMDTSLIKILITVFIIFQEHVATSNLKNLIYKSDALDEKSLYSIVKKRDLKINLPVKYLILPPKEEILKVGNNRSIPIDVVVHSTNQKGSSNNIETRILPEKNQFLTENNVFSKVLNEKPFRQYSIKVSQEPLLTLKLDYDKKIDAKKENPSQFNDTEPLIKRFLFSSFNNIGKQPALKKSSHGLLKSQILSKAANQQPLNKGHLKTLNTPLISSVDDSDYLYGLHDKLKPVSYPLSYPSLYNINNDNPYWKSWHLKHKLDHNEPDLFGTWDYYDDDLTTLPQGNIFIKLLSYIFPTYFKEKSLYTVHDVLSDVPLITARQNAQQVGFIPKLISYLSPFNFFKTTHYNKEKHIKSHPIKDRIDHNIISDDFKSNLYDKLPLLKKIQESIIGRRILSFLYPTSDKKYIVDLHDSDIKWKYKITPKNNTQNATKNITVQGGDKLPLHSNNKTNASNGIEFSRNTSSTSNNFNNFLVANRFELFDTNSRLINFFSTFLSLFKNIYNFITTLGAEKRDGDTFQMLNSMGPMVGIVSNFYDIYSDIKYFMDAVVWRIAYIVKSIFSGIFSLIS